ncbi:hypothetical protein DEO72_LG10g2059 [Vigna unguiculata]|uniref:Uncharacterized protein n=1 Tax=Vigna unguiculata TaxID=3917 RepID=A0A4D6NFU4_VIGUN|nr:hypothetical protein DEO72_LG10g2059 [Vigna unguiculata]
MEIVQDKLEEEMTIQGAYDKVKKKKIDELMLNNPEIASDISPNDPIGIIVSKEHLGRVRGLSHGARPTLAFKQSTTRLNDEKFMKMENDLTSLKNQMQILVAYIPSRDDVPEHFVVMAAGLVHPSVNQYLMLEVVIHHLLA